MSKENSPIIEELGLAESRARSGQRRWTQLSEAHEVLPVGYSVDGWEVEAVIDSQRMIAWRYL